MGGAVRPDVYRSVGEIKGSLIPSMNPLSFVYDGSLCIDVPLDFDTSRYGFTGWMALITIPSGFGNFDQIQLILTSFTPTPA